MTSAISIENAAVRLGGKLVVRGVSFEVGQAETVALLGANGSGKSTLVRTVVGLLPLAGGSITVLGQPAAEFRTRQQLGYVPQRTSAASGVPATVREVVSSGLLSASRWTRIGRGGETKIADALLAVGMHERINDCVTHLSGGQQQRVLIARALVAEPSLLVMDEPTSGVDHASQEALAELLGAFTARGGAALIVAHELGPLAPVIHRAVVLRQGQVIHDGEVPAPAGEHAHEHHDHVHPHASPLGDPHSHEGLFT